VTLVADSHIPDEVYRSASKQFAEKQLVDWQGWLTDKVSTSRRVAAPTGGFRAASPKREAAAGALSYGMPRWTLRLWPATELESSPTPRSRIGGYLECLLVYSHF
jgi:hypothetical protein